VLVQRVYDRLSALPMNSASGVVWLPHSQRESERAFAVNIRTARMPKTSTNRSFPRETMRPRRLHGACFVAILLALSVQVRAGDAQPKFAISVCSLGVTGGTLQPAELAKCMNVDGWCTATAGPQPARWNKRPDGIPANEWVSVVLAGFGEQANAFVFMFDGLGGTPRLLVQVPYRLAWTPAAKVWIPPTAQIANAIRFAHRPTGVEGVRTVLKICSMQSRSGDAAPENAAAENANKESFPPLEAMLCAAMCANGFSPTWEQAEQAITIELRVEGKSASMKLTRKAGAAIRECRKDGVPQESYCAVLSRALYALKTDSVVSDFTQLSGGGLRLLAATPERLCAVADGCIFAHDPRNGQRVWGAVPGKGSKEAYTTRTRPPGCVQVFRHSRNVAEVALAGGEEKVLSSEPADQSWFFDSRDDGTTVVARGTAIVAQRNGTALWRKDESSEFTAGPVIAKDFVFAGNADGQVVCWNLADGAEKWRAALGGPGCGGMVFVEGKLLAFCKGDDALVAVRVEDGAVAWRQPVGDVLFRSPILVGGQLLVASKSNRILLLNPADGKVAAEARWPTWLVDVLPVSAGPQRRVVCTDIRGRLSILDGATLKVLSEASLPASPCGELVFAPAFPTTWGAAGVKSAKPTAKGEDDLTLEDTSTAARGEMQPAVLVSDAEGFCYIIRIPAEKK
jgi:outer membrane protein assembly factor BamB